MMNRKRNLAATLGLVTLIALAGCSSADADPADTSPDPAVSMDTSTPEPAPTSTPAPTPTTTTAATTEAPSEAPPAAAAAGVQFNTTDLMINGDDGQAETTVPFSDGGAVLDALTGVWGEPVVTPLEGADGNMPPMVHTWESASLTTFGDGHAELTVYTTAVQSFPVDLPGIKVGSSREEAVAAGAVERGDDPNILVFDVREAAGTTSKWVDGSGADFVQVNLKSDMVVNFVSPADDYTD